MAADDEPCDGDDFEPSLGSFDRLSDQIKAWQSRDLMAVDGEADDCDREDDDPDEAKLCPAVTP